MKRSIRRESYDYDPHELYDLFLNRPIDLDRSDAAAHPVLTLESLAPR